MIDQLQFHPGFLNRQLVVRGLPQCCGHGAPSYGENRGEPRGAIQALLRRL